LKKGAARTGMQRRLLLVTGVWPTSDKPSAGIFVQRRVSSAAFYVVAPNSYRGPMAIRYLKLLAAALTARGRFAGVEAHILFPTGLIGLIAARLRRIPLVVYAHGADVRDTAKQNRVYGALAQLVATSAAAVITNSPATARLVQRLGRTPRIIPPGVDLERFRPSPRPDHRRVLYLGGNQPHKGYDLAIDLADTLAGPRLHEIDPASVPRLIAEHDVVLVPSRAEPFGLVAAEAIASGRWVVAADVDGLREIVIDGVNGFLVGDGDYRGALSRVPDYDPFEIARTVERFSLIHHRQAIDAVWSAIWNSAETDRVASGVHGTG
jgi:glycosyltransferase involved in cell wall biosynthesis